MKQLCDSWVKNLVEVAGVEPASRTSQIIRRSQG